MTFNHEDLFVKDESKYEFDKRITFLLFMLGLAVVNHINCKYFHCTRGLLNNIISSSMLV